MLYLESFQPCLIDRKVYPYRIVYPMQIESIDFAPITIFYGSNGCGKSTLLNIIAESVGVQDKTLGNTNEFFSKYTDSLCSRGRRLLPHIVSTPESHYSAMRIGPGNLCSDCNKIVNVVRHQ